MKNLQEEGQYFLTAKKRELQKKYKDAYEWLQNMLLNGDRDYAEKCLRIIDKWYKSYQSKLDTATALLKEVDRISVTDIALQIDKIEEAYQGIETEYSKWMDILKSRNLDANAIKEQTKHLDFWRRFNFKKLAGIKKAVQQGEWKYPDMIIGRYNPFDIIGEATIPDMKSFIQEGKLDTVINFLNRNKTDIEQLCTDLKDGKIKIDDFDKEWKKIYKRLLPSQTLSEATNKDLFQTFIDGGERIRQTNPVHFPDFATWNPETFSDREVAIAYNNLYDRAGTQYKPFFEKVEKVANERIEAGLIRKSTSAKGKIYLSATEKPSNRIADKGAVISTEGTFLEAIKTQYGYYYYFKTNDGNKISVSGWKGDSPISGKKYLVSGKVLENRPWRGHTVSVIGGGKTLSITEV